MGLSTRIALQEGRRKRGLFRKLQSYGPVKRLHTQRQQEGLNPSLNPFPNSLKISKIGPAESGRQRIKIYPGNISKINFEIFRYPPICSVAAYRLYSKLAIESILSNLGVFLRNKIYLRSRNNIRNVIYDNYKYNSCI